MRRLTGRPRKAKSCTEINRDSFRCFATLFYISVISNINVPNKKKVAPNHEWQCSFCFLSNFHSSNPRSTYRRKKKRNINTEVQGEGITKISTKNAASITISIVTTSGRLPLKLLQQLFVILVCSFFRRQKSRKIQTTARISKYTSVIFIPPSDLKYPYTSILKNFP